MDNFLCPVCRRFTVNYGCYKMLLFCSNCSWYGDMDSIPKWTEEEIKAGKEKAKKMRKELDEDV